MWFHLFRFQKQARTNNILLRGHATVFQRSRNKSEGLITSEPREWSPLNGEKRDGVKEGCRRWTLHLDFPRAVVSVPSSHSSPTHMTQSTRLLGPILDLLSQSRAETLFLMVPHGKPCGQIWVLPCWTEEFYLFHKVCTVAFDYSFQFYWDIINI